MPSLPFIQAPEAPVTRRVGNAASGILELPMYGGLTVGESAAVTEMLMSEQSAFVRGAQIADAISTAEGISLTEAFSVIEGSIVGRDLEDKAKELSTKYATEIQEVSAVYATAGQRNMEATVTALLRYRCNLPEWSLHDTRKLPKALFNDVWQVAQEETEAERTPAAPPSEEELGKQPAASGRGKKRTGSASSMS